MDDKMKQHLDNVVTSVINNDPQAASSAFHDYVNLKTQDILNDKPTEKPEQTDV